MDGRREEVGAVGADALSATETRPDRETRETFTSTDWHAWAIIDSASRSCFCHKHYNERDGEAQQRLKKDRDQEKEVNRERERSRERDEERESDLWIK